MDNSGALRATKITLSTGFMTKQMVINNPLKYVLAELAVLAKGQLIFLYLTRTVFTTSLFWSQWQMRWQEIFCLIGWRSKPLRILYWVKESNRNCRFGTRSFHTQTYRVKTTSLFIANHDVKTLTSFRFAICVSPRTTFSIFFFSFI